MKRAENNTILIGNSLLLDKSFQSLKATTKNLYYCMAMESGGNINFVFPEKAFKKYGIPHTTGRRGINELIANHFIKRVSGKATRENNDFSFCLDWKKEDSEETKENEIKKAKAQYAREWRAENKDKAKAIQERYWLKRVEKMKNEQNEG